MTVDTGTSSRDQAAFIAVHEASQHMGVEFDPRGDELSDLAAAVYRHGGTYGIDAVAGSYRADVRPEIPGASEPIGTGFGWTPAVALAFALVDALADDVDEANIQ